MVNSSALHLGAGFLDPSGGATETWASTLAAGNTSGGTNPVVSNGDSLGFVDGGGNTLFLSTPSAAVLQTSASAGPPVQFSNPGAGTESETFGFGAVSTTTRGTSVGYNASSDDDGAAFGHTAAASGQNATSIGRGSTASATNAVALGAFALANQNNSIALGQDAETSAANQFVVGGPLGTVSSCVIGGAGGPDTTAAIAVTWRITDKPAGSTDLAGVGITIRTGLGTGAGAPGEIALQTSRALGSGTTQQTATDTLTVRQTGAVQFHGGATTPASGSAGDLFYNTTSNAFVYHNGSAFVSLGSAGFVAGNGTEDWYADLSGAQLPASLNYNMVIVPGFDGAGIYNGARNVLIGYGADVTAPVASRADSVAIGYNAIIPTYSVAIGSGAVAGTSSANSYANIVIGYGATVGAKLGHVTIGYLAAGGSTGDDNVTIGRQATTVGGIASLALGRQASARHQYSQAFGVNATTTGANQAVWGGSGADITEFIIGSRGTSTATPADVTWRITHRTGTNQNGQALTILSSLGTGTGTPGVMNLQVGRPVASGATAHTAATTLQIGSIYVDLPDEDTGNDVTGPQLRIGYNTNGTNAGAGSIRWSEYTGTRQYTWVDNAGDFRIHTSAPNQTNDTAGTVVGTQTSTEKAKNLLSHIGPEGRYDSLKRVDDAARKSIHRFTYKSGSFNGEEFQGIVLERAPHYGMDRDADHEAGKSLNIPNAIADGFASISILWEYIEQLKSRIVALESRP